MSLPRAETTIRVERADNLTGDPYATTPSFSTVVEGVRATFVGPGGTEQHVGGEQETVGAGLRCDPCDLTHRDEVVDESTGDRWEVLWAETRRALGLDHMVVGVRRVQGVAP